MDMLGRVYCALPTSPPHPPTSPLSASRWHHCNIIQSSSLQSAPFLWMSLWVCAKYTVQCTTCNVGEIVCTANNCAHTFFMCTHYIFMCTVTHYMCSSTTFLGMWQVWGRRPSADLLIHGWLLPHKKQIHWNICKKNTFTWYLIHSFEIMAHLFQWLLQVNFKWN